MNIYRVLAEFIFAETGIVYKESDFYRLEGRVAELKKIFSLEDDNDLERLLKAPMDQQRKIKIIDIATNNETYFFRDNKPFDVLVNEILPELTNKQSSSLINIWSSGCSTGQEIYSIIMRVCEVLGQDFLGRIKIKATDISSRALQKAKEATYDDIEVRRGLSESLLHKYFTARSDKLWKFKQEYCSGINFAFFNLLTDSYPISTYEVIFCRNVLIYQNRDNKEQILKKLFTALRPGGYLILGSGESLIGFSVAFKQKKMGNMIVFQKPEDAD